MDEESPEPSAPCRGLAVNATRQDLQPTEVVNPRFPSYLTEVTAVTRDSDWLLQAGETLKKKFKTLCLYSKYAQDKL